MSGIDKPDDPNGSPIPIQETGDSADALRVKIGYILIAGGLMLATAGAYYLYASKATSEQMLGVSENLSVDMETGR
ncbi:MAG TPA: hypothetical protein PL033_17790 [Candidatus Brocadiia bacterium]|nr:hypothetical protein [Candidatus Brocadiia bacterium]